ncbi:AI-2E family transporter [Desemzia incerta]|uniref:AI-2E family transporter n=1 Tax=Desemzia incerta TaxID=82801 RepID=UPI0024C2E422|nr:AI-2E family transporter [Desemzia incerta]WHZ32948.1 AI-2E family transporter [Desemzia incerta]
MKDSKYISFLGGKNLLFTLGVAIMIGILIFIYDQISFVFEPLLVFFSSIVAPVILAVLTYFLFNPLIDWLEKHRLKRVWGVILLFLVLIGALVGLIFLVVPYISEQVTQFVVAFPEYVDNIGATIMGWTDNSVFEDTANNVIEWFNGWIGELPSNIVDYLTTAVSGISTVVSTVSNFVVIMVTFPIILFFLLKDDKKFFSYVMKVIPPKYRKETRDLGLIIADQVGSYVKGQLTISLFLGIMMFIGFTIIGLDYAGILAIVASVTSVIPYIGATLAMVPAVIIALTTSWFMLVKLIIVWLVVQFVDGNFVEPNVMGKNLKIHPLTIIIVLLVLGELLGLVGLILGVPIYAISRVVVTFIFRKFKQRYNRYYADEAGEYENVEFSPSTYQEDEESK